MTARGEYPLKENKNSAARIQANNRYNAKAYDRINIAIPKGRKELIEEMASRRGESVNGLINRLLQIESGLTAEEWKKVNDEEKE